MRRRPGRLPTHYNGGAPGPRCVSGRPPLRTSGRASPGRALCLPGGVSRTIPPADIAAVKVFTSGPPRRGPRAARRIRFNPGGGRCQRWADSRKGGASPACSGCSTHLQRPPGILVRSAQGRGPGDEAPAPGSPPARALAGGRLGRGPSVSLIFAGDVMLDDGPGRLIADGGDPLAAVAPLPPTPTTASPTSGAGIRPRRQPAGKPYHLPGRPRALPRHASGALRCRGRVQQPLGRLRPAFLRTPSTTCARPASAASAAAATCADAHAPVDPQERPLDRRARLQRIQARSFGAGASRPAWPGARTAR